MNKLLRVRYFVMVLMIGFIIVGCAPSKTTTGPSIAETGEEKKELAEQEYSIGYEYLKQKKYDEAILHFKEATKLWSEYYAAFIALARTYRAKRDIVTAEEMYNQAKKTDPNDTRAYEGLATIYFTDYKNYDKAIAEFQGGLQADSTNADLLNGMAACYAKKNEYSEAIKYYNETLKYEEENVEAMFGIAKVYMEMDEPDRAISYLEDLIIKKPKNIDVRIKLAETYVDLKRYDEAVKQYKYVIEKEPDNYYYHLQLGLVYQRQKKYANAQTEFEEARRLEPNKALPLFYLADLNIARGKYGAAENLVKEAQKIEPNNPYGYVLLGDIYERRGYASKAIWDKSKAKKNCPKLNTALSHLRTAISYYSKAKADSQFGSYAKGEITRCSNWIKTLEEDKWFYCK